MAHGVSVRGGPTIGGGKGSADLIDARIELLKGELLNTDDIPECEKIQERINKLVAGVAEGLDWHPVGHRQSRSEGAYSKPPRPKQDPHRR